MPERDIGGIGAITASRLIINMIGLIARQKAAPRNRSS
jgi:hypothetical protein